MSGLKSVDVAGAVIPLSDKIKILGATLDANLTMAPHIKALSSSCFYHILSFRQICSSLDDSTVVSVASVLISSRLDQLNSILYGTSLKHTDRLQRIQRAVAQVVLYQHSHTAPLSSNEFKQLHWLPIEWCIRFKRATLTFKALHTGCPQFISDLLQHHEPTRSLRSSTPRRLSVPRYNLTFGSRAFRFSAQEFGIHYLTISVNLSHFLLSDLSKDILFSVSLPPFSCPPCLEYLRPRALIPLRLWRYINQLLTYLLTFYLLHNPAELHSKQ